MTRIPEDHRHTLEQSIFLPMLLTILNRDVEVIKQAPFKLKKPYENLIEEAMTKIQRDLSQIKKRLKQENMKVYEVERDEAFTQFIFLYKGYEEKHNYFNPRIRNEVQDLMGKYFSLQK
ncbi:hypothetical protein LCL95_07965 [Bacillus timonensis]|nr:hypothetical protein [Bacillus timonensis]